MCFYASEWLNDKLIQHVLFHTRCCDKTGVLVGLTNHVLLFYRVSVCYDTAVVSVLYDNYYYCFSQIIPGVELC